MVLGFERINARTRQPNPNINFIRPLDGPDKELSQDFLERIAAICVPIMKANYLLVGALEEYPANREFVGRNFNNGEVIQLVLKSPGSGKWLSFRQVQLVMMHELAHCKQMNHSGAFWQLRNAYCDELKGLWVKNYTGEGFWSRGQTLLLGQYTNNTAPVTDMQPHSLCGGTYKSAPRKRKKIKSDKPKLTWKEQRDKRIAKKFGVSGTALGADQETRVQLEKGKTVKGKPRMTSNRGRELRAAALEKRINELPKPEMKTDVVDLDESSTETEGEVETIKEEDQAFDIDGKTLLKGEDGYGMVRVCEGLDNESGGFRDEMKDLEDAQNGIWETDTTFNFKAQDKSLPLPQSSSTSKKPSMSSISFREKSPITLKSKDTNKPTNSNNSRETAFILDSDEDSDIKKPVAKPLLKSKGVFLACGVCTNENELSDVCCQACSNVLDPYAGTKTWTCQTPNCRRLGYVNFDAHSGRAECGLCGAQKG
jgi:hypothetical protein